MKKLLTLILFFMIVTVRKTCKHYKNQYPFYKKIEMEHNLTSSVFRNFNKFNDLILDCNQTYNITRYVEMFPKNSLIIDEQFQFKKIFNQNQIDQIVHIDIVNINGIDINSNSFILTTKRFKQKVSILLTLSTLNVYSNSTQIDLDKCDLATYNSKNNFFKYSYYILMANVNYPSKWCPYFFAYFDTFSFYFSSITNSFLIKNRLTFNP